jgi:energy-coupling factor transporter ATP-binding protein EcfA2
MTNDFRFAAGLNQDIWQFQDLILKSRFAQALEQGTARYPIHRTVRFAARTNLEALFDEIALQPGWTAQRLDTHSMILDGDGLFISAYGGRKAEYCSCFFQIWADTPARAEQAQARFLERVRDTRIREPMFSIDWHFLTSKGELESANIEELANDVLHDAAYPELKGGVAAFIARYLEAQETVLVLQGPPGTGKTRLIRAILGQISHRNGGTAQALYTGDKKALETDQVFVKFITGWDDVFVVEDADNLLKPRAEGNDNLHRFLTIADGIVRAQGRKIIFSTNLPNVGDLDDALVRPGRCFDRIMVRELSQPEAQNLLAALCANDQPRHTRAGRVLSAARKRTHSLADVYRVFHQSA